MSHLTAKWGLIVPDEGDTDDVPSWIDQLAQKLDITITGWKADTWANRPTGAGIIDGLLFWATDQANFYLCQGGVLHQLTVAFGVGGVTTAAFGDVAALGTPANGAAAVDHKHGMPANPVTAHTALADPHSQYAFDTDIAATNANVAANTATANEVRLIQLMSAKSCPGLRRTPDVNLGVGGTTLLTVAAGRKYIVKSVIINTPGTGGVGPTFTLTAAGVTIANGYMINVQNEVIIDLGCVLNAGETLAINIASGSCDVNVVYADLASTELPTRYYTNNGTLPLGANNAFVAPSNLVITSIILGYVPASGALCQAAVNVFGDAAWSINDLYVSPNGFYVLDTPLYVGNGLQVKVYDAIGNTISAIISGYPAQS